MASRIETLLNSILNAVYGADVRGSIHDAIEECYSDVSTAKTASDDATRAASTAASNANSKADAANTAATAANSSAKAANQAKANADAATNNANSAASSANSAASAANQAKNDADAAADNANEAAVNANSKASLANDAVIAANDAAYAANQAKANADMATSNANTATNSANNAASNANTAANNANSKADLATTAAQNANEKAVTADLSAANANNAASLADSSASNANNAADAANQAKANADAATGKANDAATAATNAANAANSAASNANSSASDARVAITETQTATYNANVAAQNAAKAGTRANTAAEMIEGMTVDSEDVGPSGIASATISETSGRKHIHFVLKQGATGAPYIIKGNAFPTVGALEEAITSPSIGDQYNVGTEAPYNIYRWTGTTWEDQGKIGIAVSELTNSEIDTIWNGTAISSSIRKYLDHNGLYHLVIDKIKALFNTKVDKIDGMGLSHNDFADEYIEQLNDHDSQIVTLVNSKVDKVTGKVLSTNDFTTAYKEQIDQNKTDIAELESGKVDKVTGKVLSTNDFTTAYKEQIDQNKTDIAELESGKVDKMTGKGLSTNDFTTAYKEQIDQNKTDIASAKSYAGTMVRPNLLRNWFFTKPVNQRGLAEYNYSEKAKYSIDAWYTIFANVRLNATSITISGGHPQYTGSIRNAIEKNISVALAGKTVTLSMLVNSCSENCTYAITKAAGLNTGMTPLFADSLSAGMNKVTVALPSDLGGEDYPLLFVSVNVPKGSSATLTACKLEVGDNQTLAHQENGVWVLNEVPNMNNQLADCQRYQFSPLKAVTTHFLLGFGYAESETSVRILIPTPVTMRATPAIDYLAGSISGLILHGGAKSIVPTSIATIGISNEGIHIFFNVSGATANEPYVLRTTSAFPLFDANM